jgi:hypothetical protein
MSRNGFKARLEIDADGTDAGPDLEDLGLRLVHQGAGSDVEFAPQDESFGTLRPPGRVGQCPEHRIHVSHNRKPFGFLLTSPQ